MAVELNRETFTLFGRCDKCGAALYDLRIETGEAACSGDECGVIERFDPKRFADSEPTI